MTGKELWSYDPGPPQPRIAPCPTCGVEMVLTVSGQSLSVKRGRLPLIDVAFKVVHGLPTCFEWETERLTPDELLESFDHWGLAP